MSSNFTKWIHDRHTGRAPICWGFLVGNFDCITRIYFDCSQHAMFTICILFTTLTKKKNTFDMKGHSNQGFYRAGTTPLVLKIPGSATVLD